MAANNFSRKQKPGVKMVGDLKVYKQNQPHGNDGTNFSLKKVAEKIAEGRLHPMVRSWTTYALAKAGNPKGPKNRAKAILEAIRTVDGDGKISRWVPDPTASEYIAGAHLTLGDGKIPPLFALGDCFAEGTRMLARDPSNERNVDLPSVQDLHEGMRIWGLNRWSTVERVAFKGALSVDLVRMNNGAEIPLTRDHHVYVLDCREHPLLEDRDVGGEAGVMTARADDPNVRPCPCAHEARIEKRTRVADLRAGMMMPAPQESPLHRQARIALRGIADGDTPNMRRVLDVDRGVAVVPCWDIQTDDHRVYLPDADVTVSQCDDLTVAWGSAVLTPIMYLAAAESVGANAAVVGHAYGKDKMIEHVLGAIYDDGRWWYADPSVKDLPFGECKPFTRERVYLVPSMELLCDATVCLTERGAASGPPPPPRRGDFVSVDGVGDDYEEDEGPSTLLGFCDLGGCCDGDSDIIVELARQSRQSRVDARRQGIDNRLDINLNPLDPPPKRNVPFIPPDMFPPSHQAPPPPWQQPPQPPQHEPPPTPWQPTTQYVPPGPSMGPYTGPSIGPSPGPYTGPSIGPSPGPSMGPSPDFGPGPMATMSPGPGYVEPSATSRYAQPRSLSDAQPNPLEAAAAQAQQPSVQAAGPQTAPAAPAAPPDLNQLAQAAQAAADQARAAATVAQAAAQAFTDQQAAVQIAQQQRVADRVAQQTAIDQSATDQALYDASSGGPAGYPPLPPNDRGFFPPHISTGVTFPAAPSPYSPPPPPGCENVTDENIAECRQAAVIKLDRMANQAQFAEWADAPCSDNPLAWNIINVPPQTDYPAQELYSPWHDGIEPYSGASWEIRDSAFLQKKKGG